MKVKDYESFVVESAYMGLEDDAYNAIGLAGETGEVCEWIKKAQFRKNPKFTEAMLKKELGDVQHYLTRIVLKHGWTLKEIMQENMDKLTTRRVAEKEKV